MYLTLSDLGQESGAMTRAEYDRMLALERQGISHEQAKLMVREGAAALAAKAPANGVLNALANEVVRQIDASTPPPPPPSTLPTWAYVAFGAAVGLGVMWLLRKKPDPVLVEYGDSSDLPTGFYDRARG